MSSPRMSAGRLRTLAATGSATLLLALHFSYAEESDQDDLLALFWPRFRSFVRRFLANPRLPKAQRCPKMSGAWYRAAGNTVGPPVTPAVTADVADVAESRVDVSWCQRAGGQRVRAGRAAARTPSGWVLRESQTDGTSINGTRTVWTLKSQYLGAT